MIVLALERHFVEDELRAILRQLAARPDGALSLAGLCEVVSYVMRVRRIRMTGQTASRICKEKRGRGRKKRKGEE